MEMTAHEISSGSAWSRGRQVAHGVLLSSKPEKKVHFLRLERDREFSSQVFYAATPKCVCIRRLAGARRVSPAVLCTLLWPPFRFHRESLVLSIDVCRGHGIPPLRINIYLVEFFSGRSWPNICPGIFCLFFFRRTLVKRTLLEDFCAHSERYKNLLAGIFEIQTFFATSHFHWHRSALL